MEAPRQLRAAANREDDIAIDRRESDDESLVVMDFGPGVEASLDVVGETAIVVAGDRQFEFEIPDDASEVTVNDGILLIRETTTEE